VPKFPAHIKAALSIRWVPLFTFLLAFILLLILALTHPAEGRQQTLPLATMTASSLFAVGGVGIWKPYFLDLLARPVFRWANLGLVLTLLAWGFLSIAIALAHAANQWDEGAYLLSGLALRGYHTPYAAHRAPVPHVLAAIFADVPWLINPTLLLGLVALLTFWSSKRWGPLLAPMPLFLLVGQNAFLASVINVMAELPVALLLLAAFFLLGKENFLWAGVLFALAILTRWNVGVIPGVLTLLIALRFGRNPTLRYVIGGVVIMLVWLGLSFAFLDDPIGNIYRGNLMPAYQWAPVGHESPDFLSRSQFYLKHFFFLTPLGLLGMALRPFVPIRGCGQRAMDWVVMRAIPISFLCYAFTMLNIGGRFPRFMAPVIPLAMFVLTDAVIACCVASRVGQSERRLLMLAVVCLTIAWGVQPGSMLHELRSNFRHRDYFSREFRADVSMRVDISTPIFAPAIVPIIRANGHRAMWELRRTVIFPNAKRDANGIFLRDQDMPKAVADLVRRLEPGSLVLIPTRVGGAIKNVALVISDVNWSLYQTTGLEIHGSFPPSELRYTAACSDMLQRNAGHDDWHTKWPHHFLTFVATRFAGHQPWVYA
jgi:hypothetical protein